MKNFLISFLLSFAFVFGILFFLSKHDAVKPDSGVDFDDSIRLGAVYLRNNLQEDGRFVYLRRIRSKRAVPKKYNVLRHAGTLYAMAAYEKYVPDYGMRKKRAMGAKYLIDRYVRKLSGGMYAVVSDKKEEQAFFETAKLGGAGLALCGIGDLYRDGVISEEMFAGLGDFILFMQKSDGSFYSKYDVTSGRRCGHNPLYYPGEAALGLLYLNDFLPDKKWVAAAKRALLYLATAEKAKGKKPVFDHWTMLATLKLFETPDNMLSDSEKSVLQAHAEQMAAIALSKQITDAKHPYAGAQKGNIRPCSIATYMEGTAAIYEIVDDEELKKKLLKSLQLGNRFLSGVQIRETGDTLGGVPTAADYKKRKKGKAGLIRIDNVQHSLSAWIAYQKLAKKIKKAAEQRKQ